MFVYGTMETMIIIISKETLKRMRLRKNMPSTSALKVIFPHTEHDNIVVVVVVDVDDNVYKSI